MLHGVSRKSQMLAHLRRLDPLPQATTIFLSDTWRCVGRPAHTFLFYCQVRAALTCSNPPCNRCCRLWRSRRAGRPGESGNDSIVDSHSAMRDQPRSDTNARRSPFRSRRNREQPRYHWYHPRHPRRHYQHHRHHFRHRCCLRHRHRRRLRSCRPVDCSLRRPLQAGV